MLEERQRFCIGCAAPVSDLDRARLTALEARGTERHNDEYRGNDKVMRERQRVEILPDLLAVQTFIFIAYLIARTRVSAVAEAA
jgi:hypothetical protein